MGALRTQHNPRQTGGWRGRGIDRHRTHDGTLRTNGHKRLQPETRRGGLINEFLHQSGGIYLDLPRISRGGNPFGDGGIPWASTSKTSKGAASGFVRAEPPSTVIKPLILS